MKVVNVCFVLLAALLAINAYHVDEDGLWQGEPIQFSSRRALPFDEWARDYNPQLEVQIHKQYLRDAVNHENPATITSFPQFDIIAKINQNPVGQPINEQAVFVVVNQITSAINQFACRWEYNSDYLSLDGTNRFSFYGGISCENTNIYLQLVDHPLFHNNVLHVRMTSELDGGFGTFDKNILSYQGVDIPDIHIQDSTPMGTDAPQHGGCNDYEDRPFMNWYADAMNGNMDCNLIKDDCSYNKGYGGTLYLIDTGVTSSHPEFAGKVRSGQLSFRDHLTPQEKINISPFDDELGHGTNLAALAIGKNMGIVKDANLVSIKVVIESGKTSVNAITKAINQIIRDNMAAGVTRLAPQVVFGGVNLVWQESVKSRCNVEFDVHPQHDAAVLNDGSVYGPVKRGDMKQTNPLIVDPPRMYGYFQQDCAYPVTAAVRRLISLGTPYLFATGNGFQNGQWGVASGADMCYYMRWQNAVVDCMFDYLYMPMFMIDGYAANPNQPGNQGWINRGITVGGYQEDYDNARWHVEVNDTTGNPEYLDFGGANYGSRWIRSNYGQRCVDYAAPAARFQTAAVLSTVKYGDWSGSWGYEDWVGTYFTQPYSRGYPFSGTSYAVPLAAGSVLETMIAHWNVMRPTAFFPDYGFGDRLISTVDSYNVISMVTTNDAETNRLYTWASNFVTSPVAMTTPPNEQETCVDYLGIYYNSDAYPTRSLIEVPDNRNLMMPQYYSKRPECQVYQGTPGQVPQGGK